MNIREKNLSCELGYCLGETWWGRGIMTEAVRAICNYLLDEVGFVRVFARHDVENLRKMDDQFHDTIYELCGRMVIHDTLLPLHKKTQRYRRSVLDDSKRLDRSIEEHRAICDAICSGEAEKAQELTCRHITNAKEAMIERFHYNG